jgi:hypothetical protein
MVHKFGDLHQSSTNSTRGWVILRLSHFLNLSILLNLPKKIIDGKTEFGGGDRSFLLHQTCEPNGLGICRFLQQTVARSFFHPGFVQIRLVYFRTSIAPTHDPHEISLILKCFGPEEDTCIGRSGANRQQTRRIHPLH